MADAELERLKAMVYLNSDPEDEELTDENFLYVYKNQKEAKTTTKASVTRAINDIIKNSHNLSLSPRIIEFIKRRISKNPKLRPKEIELELKEISKIVPRERVKPESDFFKNLKIVKSDVSESIKEPEVEKAPEVPKAPELARAPEPIKAPEVPKVPEPIVPISKRKIDEIKKILRNLDVKIDRNKIITEKDEFDFKEKLIRLTVETIDELMKNETDQEVIDYLYSVRNTSIDELYKTMDSMKKLKESLAKSVVTEEELSTSSEARVPETITLTREEIISPRLEPVSDINTELSLKVQMYELKKAEEESVRAKKIEEDALKGEPVKTHNLEAQYYEDPIVDNRPIEFASDAHIEQLKNAEVKVETALKTYNDVNTAVESQAAVTTAVNEALSAPVPVPVSPDVSVAASGMSTQSMPSDPSSEPSGGGGGVGTPQPPIDELPTKADTKVPSVVQVVHEKVKYHRKQVKIMYGTDISPPWDTNLTNDFFSLEFEDKSEIGDWMDMLIAVNGNKMLVKQKVTEDDPEELHILLQMHFTIERNMHIGKRSKTATVSLSALMGLRNSVSGQQDAIQAPQQDPFVEASNMNDALSVPSGVSGPTVLSEEPPAQPVQTQGAPQPEMQPASFSTEQESNQTLSDAWSNRTHQDGHYVGEDNPLFELVKGQGEKPIEQVTVGPVNGPDLSGKTVEIPTIKQNKSVSKYIRGTSRHNYN